MLLAFETYFEESLHLNDQLLIESISVFDSYFMEGVHLIPLILEISRATSMFYF